MSEKETIVVGKESQEIEVRPITLIFKSPTMSEDIKYPDRAMLTPTDTVEYVWQVKKLHPFTAKLFKMVFPEFGEVTLEAVRDCDKGRQHVLGLLDMSLCLTDASVKVGWKLPETYLHPAHQANLGDALLWLMQYGAGSGGRQAAVLE